MAYREKPKLTMVFIGENGTKEISFDNVKATPVSADINAAGAAFNEGFMDPTLEYSSAYYSVDSVVASVD